MCIDTIKKLFEKWQPPYPEELYNPDATEDNIELRAILNRWLYLYKVPAESSKYWLEQIIIEIDKDYQYPAAAWTGSDGKRHMKIQPGYLNPGVIAHEQAHNSYSLMKDWQKDSFSLVYHSLMNKDNKQLKKLWEYNDYGLKNDIEAHAEIYRYLGEYMPDELKIFYPKLL